MFRRAFVVAAIVSWQVLLHSGGARAGDDQSFSEPRDEARGMFILKFPFGGEKTFSAPRVGFDFQMERKSDLDYLKDSYDPETGRRLPEVDTGSMRTWSLEPPEYSLPDEEQGESEPYGPRNEEQGNSEPYGPQKEPQPSS